VASLGSSKVPDDMTIDRKGRLLIAAFGSGEVIRLDPDTGATCAIASGLQDPTSVRFGRGHGWSSHSLFVTGADGTLRKLTSP
jgi:sugar lactone lactonase YvrE